MSLNVAQIKDQAKSIWGRDIDDMTAQNIMNNSGGGDDFKVGEYLRNDPTFNTQQANSQRLALEASQKAQQDDYLNRFRAAVGGQETMTAASNRIGGDLGVPQLRSTAQGLVSSLESVPQVQSQATRGFSVNANQLARIIGSKQAELAPVAQKAVTQQQAAEGELGNRLGLLAQDQTRELTPFTTEQSLMSEQLAREYSGFSQQKQNELSVVMQKLANGQAIQMAELQAANDLAKAKYTYDSTKKDTDRYLNGSSFYDTKTGQWLSAPKTATTTTPDNVLKYLQKDPLQLR